MLTQEILKFNMIPFNKPFLTGKETDYITDAVVSGKISGNGKYTQLCQQFFENKFCIKKTLLTTSCTDALEMAAILIDIKEGDEVIMPSYTFVSTATAFVLRGAKIVFADSLPNHPNMDCSTLEALITSVSFVSSSAIENFASSPSSRRAFAYTLATACSFIIEVLGSA